MTLHTFSEIKYITKQNEKGNFGNFIEVICSIGLTKKKKYNSTEKKMRGWVNRYLL
jgi:hypothetical protein